jgi:arginine decarboxylase
MEIAISGVVGQGPNELSAFDAALVAAGAANFNLLALSSVIPPGAQIRELSQAANPAGCWGDRLYVVMADMRTSEPGAQAWAGLGWIQDKQSGRGLFVEHSGSRHADVKRQILESLSALAENRSMAFGPPHFRICGGTCVRGAICALAIATYQSEPWATSSGSALDQIPDLPTGQRHGRG